MSTKFFRVSQRGGGGDEGSVGEIIHRDPLIDLLLHSIARSLLGKILVHEAPEGVVNSIEPHQTGGRTCDIGEEAS